MSCVYVYYCLDSLLATHGGRSKILSCIPGRHGLRIDVSRERLAHSRTSLVFVVDLAEQRPAKINRVNAHPFEQCCTVWWQVNCCAGLSQESRLLQNLQD